MKTAKTVAYVILTVAVAVFAVKTFIYGGSKYQDPNDSPLYESMLTRSIGTSFRPSEFVLGQAPAQQYVRQHPPQQPQQFQGRPQVGPPPKLRSAAEYLEAAMSLYTQGRYKEAIPLFDAAIKADPKNPQTYFSLANCYLVTGDKASMLLYYEAAAKAVPEDATAHFFLGVAYTQVGKSEEARSAFRKAIELDPQHTHAHEGMAKLLKGEGKHEEAMKEYQYEIDLCKKLIKEKPEEPSNYNRLAQFYLRNDINLKEGVELVTKALKIDPERASTLATAAQLHFKNGNTQKALELIDKAIAKKTDRGPYYEMMKRHFIATPKNKPEEAKEGEKKEEEEINQ